MTKLLLREISFGLNPPGPNLFHWRLQRHSPAKDERLLWGFIKFVLSLSLTISRGGCRILMGVAKGKANVNQ